MLKEQEVAAAEHIVEARVEIPIEQHHEHSTDEDYNQLTNHTFCGLALRRSVGKRQTGYGDQTRTTTKMTQGVIEWIRVRWLWTYEWFI